MICFGVFLLLLLHLLNDFIFLSQIQIGVFCILLFALRNQLSHLCRSHVEIQIQAIIATIIVSSVDVIT